MAAKIKADVLQALQDWNAGKPVKSLELGHVHRMTHTEEQIASHPNMRNSIDLSKRLSNDQERAHAFCFTILEHFKTGTPEFKDFQEFCDDLAAQWNDSVSAWPQDLSDEEATAAISLAWKALHIGWARAIAGHPAENYIEVTNPAAKEVAAT